MRRRHVTTSKKSLTLVSVSAGVVCYDVVNKIATFDKTLTLSSVLAKKKRAGTNWITAWVNFKFTVSVSRSEPWCEHWLSILANT